MAAVSARSGFTALAGENTPFPDNPKNGTKPPNAIAPSEALKRLVEGNARYAQNQPRVKDYSAGRAARAEAQYPIAAILGCADSRVSPELLFDQGPGELFVVRVAGNYMNTDNLASLEYGVGVLGHSSCGAVKAVVQNAQHSTPPPVHINLIVDALQPGVQQAIKGGEQDVLQRAIEANVRYNVTRLRGAQPVLAQAVSDKKIEVVGAVYELSTGKIKLL